MENTNMVVSQSVKNAAKARGERLKTLRSLTGLTRDEFCNDSSGLNPNTFKDWELGRANGLTLKSAERVIAHIAQYNVVCSLEWLMQGEGAEPMVLNANPTITVAADSNIQKELSIFQALLHNILYTEIKDSLSHPVYQQGDIVAGVKLPPESIAALTGQLCLVETENGEILVKKILKGVGNHRFILSTLSSDNQIETVLSSAARITRIYRP